MTKKEATEIIENYLGMSGGKLPGNDEIIYTETKYDNLIPEVHSWSFGDLMRVYLGIGWVSVEERKPLPETDLVFESEDELYVGYYDYGFFSFSDGHIEINNVTKWMYAENLLR